MKFKNVLYNHAPDLTLLTTNSREHSLNWLHTALPLAVRRCARGCSTHDGLRYTWNLFDVDFTPWVFLAGPGTVSCASTGSLRLMVDPSPALLRWTLAYDIPNIIQATICTSLLLGPDSRVRGVWRSLCWINEWDLVTRHCP